eukprot:CAMPEP_0196780852 /NCGR_PEP_ID=MMETSP1104-20130614/8657_1 /TAXON_ID=33652 /ORGANISM="Cafeteria sp., Strain Caron Lab Isolate" /LENGTH=167 /DNA_ID=CAMNT_0042151067 /DNA_START=18 /DNA_END=521 /DNA_ORIENTATION=+
MIRVPALRRVAGRSVNWQRVYRSVEHDEELTGNVRQLQSLVGTIQTSYDAAPRDLAAIDWDTYRTSIKKTGFVDDLKAKYDAFKVPSLPDELTAAWEEVAAEELKEVADFEQVLGAELEIAKQELSWFQAAAVNEDTTLADVEFQYPELVAEVEREIANGEWDKNIE